MERNKRRVKTILPNVRFLVGVSGRVSFFGRIYCTGRIYALLFPICLV